MKTACCNWDDHIYIFRLSWSFCGWYFWIALLVSGGKLPQCCLCVIQFMSVKALQYSKKNCCTQNKYNTCLQTEFTNLCVMCFDCTHWTKHRSVCTQMIFVLLLLVVVLNRLPLCVLPRSSSLPSSFFIFNFSFSSLWWWIIYRLRLREGLASQIV